MYLFSYFSFVILEYLYIYTYKTVQMKASADCIRTKRWIGYVSSIGLTMTSSWSYRDYSTIFIKTSNSSVSIIIIIIIISYHHQLLYGATSSFPRKGSTCWLEGSVPATCQSLMDPGGCSVTVMVCSACCGGVRFFGKITRRIAFPMCLSINSTNLASIRSLKRTIWLDLLS